METISNLFFWRAIGKLGVKFEIFTYLFLFFLSFSSFFLLLFLFFLLYLASIHLTVTQQFLWLPSFVQNSCSVLTIVRSVVLGVLQVCFFFWRHANLIYFEVRGKIQVIFYQVWWRVVHNCIKAINEFCI